MVHFSYFSNITKVVSVYGLFNIIRCINNMQKFKCNESGKIGVKVQKSLEKVWWRRNKLYLCTRFPKNGEL
jgi:hypothetical protein